MRKTAKEPSLSREYYYASHHHLIPLYVLSGIALLAISVIGCFLAVLWQNDERESFRPAAETTVSTIESLYLPATVTPADKKQYVFPAGIRFNIEDPYDTLRYAYDPGTSGTRTSSTITLTTTSTLQELAAPIRSNPERVGSHTSRLQQCARQFVVRFEPGLTAFGGFGPLQDIRLKDGRTAYIHKNTACVPNSTQAMSTIEAIEKTILSIESY